MFTRNFYIFALTPIIQYGSKHSDANSLGVKTFSGALIPSTGYNMAFF